MTSEERQKAYQCDITYVTNNELGFDYLRDNMVIYKEPSPVRSSAMRPWCMMMPPISCTL